MFSFAVIIMVCHLMTFPVNKRLAWTVLWNSVTAPDLDKINLIKELLNVKFHKGQISLFSESEVDFMIWFYVLHSVLFVYFCIFSFFYIVFYLCTQLYEFYNK